MFTPKLSERIKGKKWAVEEVVEKVVETEDIPEELDDWELDPEQILLHDPNRK